MVISLKPCSMLAPSGRRNWQLVSPWESADLINKWCDSSLQLWIDMIMMRVLKYVNPPLDVWPDPHMV